MPTPSDEPARFPEERISRTLRSLQANEFLAYFVPEVQEAVRMVLDGVQERMQVGLGGSLTLRELGLPAALKGKGATVLDHWDDSLSLEETLRTRHEQLDCDLFLTSVNAVTERGELVSRDAVGNRICATTFGPKKVMILAGVQKIVPDLAAAFERIERIAAPRRAAGLNLKLPCTKGTGCADCRDPGRICRATLILHKRPLVTDITVILIGQPVGA
jgi:L-lactate utilization protein LutB